MLLTPTYHAFDMYQVHQDADALFVNYDRSAAFGPDGFKLPAVSASATKDKTGALHLSLVNPHPSQALKLECAVNGKTVGAITGTIITGSKTDAENTYAEPDVVTQRPFSGYSLVPGGLAIDLPPKSILTLEIQ
jgi:alpha-N-arabinofuranosidase